MKSLEVVTPVFTRKKLNILKISDLSWTQQQTKVSGQAATSKPCEFRKSQQRSAYLEQKSWEPLTYSNS